MPVQPKPYVLQCPSCGWKAYHAPSSDVLMPHQHPEQCPDCSFSPLDVRTPGILEALKGCREQTMKRLKG